MARRRRTSLGVGFFHVLNRSARRRVLFQRPRDYRAFLAILAEGLDRHPARLLSYCVLANHWHLVLGPVDPRTLSKLLHWVTVTHAVRWQHHRQTVGEGPVYQGRFKSIAIGATDELVRACRYVERNGLRAGLVGRAEDWPWCSLSERRYSRSQIPLASTPFLASQAWADYVNAPITLQERLRLGGPGTELVETVENRHDPLLHLPHGAEAPGGFVRGVEGAEEGGRVSGRADEDDPHAHVERPKHLRLGHAARPLQPAEDRRRRPPVAVE